MNCREKVLGTLGFKNMQGEGSVQETFYPWDQAVDNWTEQGLPERYGSKYLYTDSGMAEPVAAYEKYLGFDSVRRLDFTIPWWKFCRQGEITDQKSWEKLKSETEKELAVRFTDQRIEEIYEKYREPHERGEFSVCVNIQGFFWIPRDLMGIENHLYAFYDEPELMHEINQFVLEIYYRYLTKIVEILQPEVLYLSEDLSGKNGPMVSPDSFEEFVGSYYEKLFPVLRENGVKNIFIDTDGDFRLLIPYFLKAGADGFLPMDVNAGMDIVEVRKEFPKVKFIGAFNKLVLLENEEAIDKEFARLLPVIRQGGYIPGLDHQAAPNTPFANYRYYISRLKEAMKQAGADACCGTRKD
ncbi:MAG: hypothetical protein KH828_00570 [Clostridiales bacterium]|nr:hypothetical protein [Clostridiales bacterium]